MRVLILGGDGYLGWPTAMHFSMLGDEVCVIDNYLRRQTALEKDSEPLFRTPNLHQRTHIFKEKTGNTIKVVIGDCVDYHFLFEQVKSFAPDVVIHYAEQPSAPYSMADYDAARLTFDNNLGATFSLIWAVLEAAPDCHIVKLGTMGEYGTPNIDIEEGWLEVAHNGRKDKFLYPRQAGSLYHTTKVLDTDLLWFYVRSYGLRVTDLMQGPVYGLKTKEIELDHSLSTFFHYDDIFGTVLNRFITQAVAGIPLTVYGKGGQTRGYLNIIDTLQCVELAVKNPPEKGGFSVLNQFTEQFTVLELAEKVRSVGKSIGQEVKIKSVENPRKEAEEHYYNAAHSGLIELGLEPHLLTDDVVADMLETVMRFKNKIDCNKILPRVKWKS